MLCVLRKCWCARPRTRSAALFGIVFDMYGCNECVCLRIWCVYPNILCSSMCSVLFNGGCNAFVYVLYVSKEMVLCTPPYTLCSSVGSYAPGESIQGFVHALCFSKAGEPSVGTHLRDAHAHARGRTHTQHTHLASRLRPGCSPSAPAPLARHLPQMRTADVSARMRVSGQS